jgi:hypothetical protein
MFLFNVAVAGALAVTAGRRVILLYKLLQAVSKKFSLRGV